MKLSTHIHRGLVAFALCAAVSAYAASHPVVFVGAPQEMPMLGTITVTATPDQGDENVVLSETQGKARVTVGEPITLGPKEAQPQLVAMR